MPTAESKFPRGKSVAATAALILVAATAGLVLAPDRSSHHPDTPVTYSEAAAAARAETLEETTASFARRGFREGLAEGLSHGRMTGRQVGRMDAEIVIGEQEAAKASSEAATTQAELSTMSTTPPIP